MDKLYVGASREDVTPKIGGHMFGYNLNTFSTSVNDNLTVTALAFSYGETKFIMISATVNFYICPPKTSYAVTETLKNIENLSR